MNVIDTDTDLRDRMQFALSQLATFEEENLETWVVGFHMPVIQSEKRPFPYCIKPIPNAQAIFFLSLISNDDIYMSLLSPKVFRTLDCVLVFLPPLLFNPLHFHPLPRSLYPCPVYHCDSVSFPAPFPSTPLSFLSLTFEKGRYDFGCRHSQIYGSYISSVTDETG